MTLSIPPRVHDLGGGFTVKRLLPHARMRSVGPFVFFDHIGPALLEGDHPMEVRPHPHIGLATVTYLWEGAIMHRDSLGTVQMNRAEDINLMTAGRGIVHSERTPPAERASGPRLHGLQLWVALPSADEEIEPSFRHHPAATLPEMERGVIRAFGQHDFIAQLFGHTRQIVVVDERGVAKRHRFDPEQGLDALVVLDDLALELVAREKKGQ